MSVVTPILVVEDEAMIRMALVDILTDGGFSIEECGSGAAAIALIDQVPDLQGLITDIRLGDGPDGWAVARNARKRFPHLAVLYVTGDSAAEWTSQGVPGSVILQKPYADAQLMTAIANLSNEALQLRSADGTPSE